MTDKVQKIREEVERLKGWNNNVRNSTRHMTLQEEDFNRGKHSSYLEILNFIDSLQKEPVREKKCMFTKDSYTDEDRKVLCEDCKEKCEYSKKEEPVSSDLEDAANNALEGLLDKYDLVGTGSCLEMFKLGAEWQKTKDESCSKDLGEYINELSKQFPEVSFAKLSRIAVRVAKWQKANLWKPADGDDLPEIDKEVVAFQETFPTDVDVQSLLKIVVAHRPNPEGYDGKSIATGKVEHYTPETYNKGGWNIPDVKFWLDVELPKEIEL